MRLPRATDSTGRQRRRGGIAALIVLAVLLATLTGGAQLWKADLIVQAVSVDGNRIVRTEDILRTAQVPMGTRLEDVELAAIRARVRKNPVFREVSVHRDYPQRIVIRVEERIPVAAVAAGRLYSVDAEGMILPPLRSEHVFDLPVITATAAMRTPVPGKRLSHPTVLEALEVVLAARDLQESVYRRISEVHIQPNGDLMLYTADYGVPVVFGRGDVVDKLARLEGFWSAVVSGRGAHALRALDLRFDDQVVARWDPTQTIVAQ